MLERQRKRGQREGRGACRQGGGVRARAREDGGKGGPGPGSVSGEVERGRRGERPWVVRWGNSRLVFPVLDWLHVFSRICGGIRAPWRMAKPNSGGGKRREGAQRERGRGRGRSRGRRKGEEGRESREGLARGGGKLRGGGCAATRCVATGGVFHLELDRGCRDNGRQPLAIGGC